MAATITKNFDAVFFDLDGTLVNSVEDIAAAVNHVRIHLRLDPLPLTQVGSYVGDGVHALMERALQTKNVTRIEEAISLWKPYYEKHCVESTLLYEGILPLLEALSASGIPLAVITNKPSKPSHIILEGLGIASYFQVVVGGDTTAKRKPDSEPVHYAANKINVKTSRILLVGDSPNDVLSARNAEAKSCGVTWGIGALNHLQASTPDFYAHHPSEILKLVFE